MTTRCTVVLVVWALSLLSCGPRTEVTVQESAAVGGASSQPAGRRPFHPFIDGRWIGNGISYGAHRDGQTPGGSGPTREQVREDLHILAQHWNLLRMYAAGPESEMALQIIREEHLPLKMVLGAWIAMEERFGDGGAVVERFPQAQEANRRQVATLIQQANAYSDIVLAVTVGNETQVFWSAHKIPVELLIRYIREVRGAVKAPVATADDFNFWNKPESRLVAREVDFIVTHIYAMWAGQPLERALPFTQEKYAEVAQMHPGLPLVLGEAGWATQKHNEGEQAKLIKGEAGETQQKTFYDEFTAWTTRARIANFYFEAFDENWKGGSHSDEVEKHWGLFRADRTPKLVLQGP